MACNAEEIINLIDKLICDKLAGTTFDGMTDRRIGDLGISQATTLSALTAMRQFYVNVAAGEDPYLGQQTIIWR